MHIFLPLPLSSSAVTIFHYPSSCRWTGFRSLPTDAAKCKQLHLQSLFSFRRLAPADDYLGSPFQHFTFRLPASFRLSTPVSRCFIFLLLQFTLLSLRSLPLLDTQLPVLPFSPPSVPPPSGFPNALISAFASFRSSPFTLSGFPYSPSGSAYSALCLFPFVLSCFAPTAVPQALISLPAFQLSMPCFPLRYRSFVRTPFRF